MTEVVIMLPGIMGSVLESNGRVIWPGSVLDMVRPFKHMKELLDPKTKAVDVIRKYGIVGMYSALIEAIDLCGFREHDVPRTLFVHAYDWRKDNALAAEGLADRIDEVVKQVGSETRINLVAHSMGGLVSRYYLESGLYDSRRGFANVWQLITLGTPHLGAPVALPIALGQERKLFLDATQAGRLAGHPDFPAVYQLFPPRGQPFATERGSDTRVSPVDVYSSPVASRLGLEQKNLTSAEEFHARLNLARKPQHVRYFFFTGTRHKTVNSVQLQLGVGRGAAIRIERDGAGDGTVPIWSASLTGVQMEPVCGEHGEIFKHRDLQRVLGELLGKPGVLLALGVVPELSVTDKVVDAGDAVVVTIDLPRGTQSLDGELRLRRIVDADGVHSPSAQAGVSYPIVYAGATIDHLAVSISAPDFAGIYEIGLVVRGGLEPVATTELFVHTA